MKVPMSQEVRNHLLNELERSRPRRSRFELWTRALLLTGFSFFAFLGLVRVLVLVLVLGVTKS